MNPRGFRFMFTVPESLQSLPLECLLPWKKAWMRACFGPAIPCRGYEQSLPSDADSRFLHSAGRCTSPRYRQRCPPCWRLSQAGQGPWPLWPYPWWGGWKNRLLLPAEWWAHPRAYSLHCGEYFCIFTNCHLSLQNPTDKGFSIFYFHESPFISTYLHGQMS